MAPAGLSVEVLVAGVLFSVSAGITGLSSLTPQDPPISLLFLGWPVLAGAGGALLDQHPGSRVGRALAALSLAPVLILVWSALRFAEPDSAASLARASGELAAPLSIALATALPWAVRAPRDARLAAACAALAGSGALLVLLADTEVVSDGLRAPGWVLAALGTLGVWLLVAISARHGDRAERRRVAWLLITLTTWGGVVVAAWTIWSGTPGYYATCTALVIGTLTIAGLCVRHDFRPLDEHLLNLGLLVAALGAAALTATLVRVGSELAHQPSTNTSTLFTAVLTAGMAAPAALAVRRSVLARRYGSGLIAPDDVARITADLHARTEPRDLLGKAARMVAAASGSPEAQIVLGDEAPVAPEHWVAHALVVGGDRVGTLLIASSHPEGPEVRQRRIVAQLLPTVALVARAVGLAVEAEHARQDVSRELDAERKRVMGDLHDGLGPVLAGMSMRVQAMLRTTTSPESAAMLRELADGLSTSRTDLRRIVAGITPSTLDDGDLEAALSTLVDSFRGATDTPKVGLTVTLDDAVRSDVQVAVYRSVAEGITNALRHAAASTIDVQVVARDDLVLVDVVDDGVGGPVVPGVGLSSLARRAESLGGRITVSTADPAGTVMHLELPADMEVPA
jgi:signal transduction histidine kinase